MQNKQMICFVIMGFGKKTDYETGRTLDLDATYDAIIEPAVIKNNIRCIKANEILHSGIIDSKMYEMLLHAELVIADISTGNVNAVYELGVRHALRPHATIIMKENAGKLHFDLNHTNTFPYVHMGEDIGSKEAKRASEALTELISKVLSSGATDSPVYTYLPKLKRPSLSAEEYEEILKTAEEIQDLFSEHLSNAETAAKASEHRTAANEYIAALRIASGNPYLVQQAALHTYKSEFPSKWLALDAASKLISRLEPENSNDPETLGIAGAIYKNMWLLNDDVATLSSAIAFYKRGFDVRGDYYNGENAATCFEIRSDVQHDPDEAQYDRMSAAKIRKVIVEDLKTLTSSDDFDQRSDQKWVFATLANCHFALNEIEEAEKYENLFLNYEPTNWEKMTYEKGKQHAKFFGGK